MELFPRESSLLIISNADHVQIDNDAVDNLAMMLKKSVDSAEYDLKKWKSDNPLHPQQMDEKTLDWIFLIDSLNFSFWPDVNKEFTINGEVGYWALCSAIKRALDEQIPLFNPYFYSKLSLEQAKYIFRVDDKKSLVEIPMLEERVSILNQNGSILIKHFKGSFANCIRKCNSSAMKLLSLIYEYFPSFRDEAIYKNYKVTFMKRAQILIADIWACFEGQDFGLFTDIDQLTMFADYRIPQVLHYFDVLKYSSELESKLKENNLLENNHQYELEIRGGSIHSIELVRDSLKKLYGKEDKKVPNSIQIDFYLWGYRRSNSEVIDRKSPFHRVRSIFY